jgi:hypothetical protein
VIASTGLRWLILAMLPPAARQELHCFRTFGADQIAASLCEQIHLRAKLETAFPVPIASRRSG